MLAYVTNPLTQTFFPIQLLWPKCFCCGGPEGDETGMIVPFASAFTVFFRQLIMLLRNVANPSYWNPSGVSLTNTPESIGSKLADNLEDIKKTWISRFLSPFSDALCRFLTNSACLLTMLISDTCSGKGDNNIRYKVISSIFSYLSQALIRVIAIIEAAVKLISQELPGQCVGDPKKTNFNADDPNSQGSDGSNPVSTCCYWNWISFV
jgi:hypothetical protein